MSILSWLPLLWLILSGDTNARAVTFNHFYISAVPLRISISVSFWALTAIAAPIYSEQDWPFSIAIGVALGAASSAVAGQATELIGNIVSGLVLGIVLGVTLGIALSLSPSMVIGAVLGMIVSITFQATSNVVRGAILGTVASVALCLWARGKKELPSRWGLALLLLGHAFLIWFSLLGGYRVLESLG